MPRLQPRTQTDADPKARPALAGVQKKLGTVPNLMATMANSPAVLEAYLGFSGSLAKGSLSSKLREQIALTVAEANGCNYCLAAHSALGRMAGLSAEEIADSRRGTSPARRTEAVLAFAARVVADRGHVGDEDVASLRDVGLDDAGIAEVVANIALNLFSNYFNHVAETEIDFPEVERLTSVPAHAIS